MKLTGITLQNWLCHARLDVRITPLSVVCGPNGRGKSAIADAIAFTILSDLRRVTLKGERQELVTEGAEDGSVGLHFGDLTIARDVLSGKLAKAGRLPSAAKSFDALPYVLDSQLFARQPIEGRRAGLLKMVGISVDTTTISAKLEKRGRQVKLLGAKFQHGAPIEKWHEEAKAAQSEARGAWKQITGETYGSKKAEDWRAEVLEPPSPQTLTAAQEAVRAAEADITVMTKTLGQIEQAEAGTFGTDKAARRKMLEGKAKLLPEAESYLIEQRETLADTKNTKAVIQDRLTKGQGNPPGAKPEYCPHCGGAVIRHEGSLEVFNPALEPQPSASSEIQEAAETLEVVEGILMELEARVALATDNAVSYRRAKADLAALESSPMPEDLLMDSGGLPSRADVEHHLAHGRHEKALAEQRLADLQRQVAAAITAAQTTKKAMETHQRIVAWGAIVDDLAPTGIQQEMLGIALAPLNERLRDLSAAFKWPQPRIGADMSITLDGRRYSLRSESEQWRGDALMALAVATLTDLRLVVLDRFDVLEPGARQAALGAFYSVVRKGVVDTCILVGTMKAPPSAPSDVAVTWLGEPIAAEKAAA